MFLMMSSLRVSFLGTHWYLFMVKCVALIKESNWGYLVVKCLALHL